MLSRLKRHLRAQLVIPVLRMYRTFPATTKSTKEKAWRRKYFSEMWRCEWKLCKLNSLFDPFFALEKRKERERKRTLWLLHHPQSSTRQLMEWRQLGSLDPPPAVEKTIEKLQGATQRVDHT